MFDRNEFHEGDTNVTNIRQLPHDTADAARLYGEMVSRAEAEVTEAVVKRFGVGNVVVIERFRHEGNFDTNTLATRVIFKVNDETHDIFISTEATMVDELIRVVSHEVARKVHDHLTDIYRRRK